MKALVRFLIIFTCTKLIISKPQHLQEQPQYHLDPLNEPQFEYPPKDQDKRTLGFKHYAFGKHIGIHPHGYKYVLGYSPINIKYVPVIKPVTVLKPVLQQSIKHLWKPVVPPTRQYLPPMHVDHGWKPVVHKPWVDEHVHTVVDQPVPVPAPAPVVPLKPLHNYYYFQTPVAKPFVPQVPLLHVARPQLPVLPLGASFPAPILPAHTAPGPLYFPSAPTFVPAAVHPQPVAPVYPAPHPPVAVPVHPHPQPVHPYPDHIHPVYSHPEHLHPVHHHPDHIHPVHSHPEHLHPVHHHPDHFHPVHTHPDHLHPVHTHPDHLHPVSPPVAAVPAQPHPPAHLHPVHTPPISVEFHGTRHFVPFNNQFPITAVQAPVPKVPEIIIGRQPHALPLPPEVHTNFIPQVTHLHPHPQVPNQVTHLHPVPAHQPPEVQDHGPAFNPAAAIQPGQTDLQVPLHLPQHPHFRQIHGFEHTHTPQFPPFQNPGNVIRPSVSLEPPITHGHS